MSERRFPILVPWRDRGAEQAAKTIPWSVAEAAFAAAEKRHGRTYASVEDVAARGGYGERELDAFLPRWRKMAEELDGAERRA